METKVVGNDQMATGEGLGYEIWLGEPQSVERRRQKFMSQMGLSKSSLTSSNNGGGEEGLDLLEKRVSESSNAECCSSSSSNGSVWLGRECGSEANSMVDDDEEEEEEEGFVVGESKPGGGSSESSEGEVSSTTMFRRGNGEEKKMKRRWSWKQFVNRKEDSGGNDLPSKASNNRVVARVKCNKKKYMELSGLFVGQEIQAHKGFIWAMKFSPDGKHLATGGEDGIVRIWKVGTTAAAAPGSKLHGGFGSQQQQQHTSIVIPNMVFRIDEAPVHELRGHSSDVLDLAWSSSNMLLSSSKDKTVRLWRIGCNHCLNVFHHSNYVTCIQFNPVNENQFISGSIDGKVRIWGVYEARVIDWTDVREVISAICYKPDGKGFVVGSIRGRCRFYELSANDLQLEAEVHIQGRKRTSSNRITGIQFSQENSPKVMITSEDSKVRIFHGFDLIHKFKGLPRSGNQMSASFTSTGKHIISVGDDCQVYVWNYSDRSSSFYGGVGGGSKHIKSEQSFEHFSCQGVSVAVPWPGSNKSVGSGGGSESGGRFLAQQGTRHRGGGGGGRRGSKDMDRFSLGNWYNFVEGGRGNNSSSSAATWPEERLFGWGDDDSAGAGARGCGAVVDRKSKKWFDAPETWGMVIVTGSWDGKITTFNNYGLPTML